MRRFHPLITLLFILQAVLGARVMLRLLRTANGKHIEPVAAARASETQSVSILIPVLNEIDRLAPCLDGVIAQGSEVTEIIVIDGGSTDGTPALVERYRARDSRLRLIEEVVAPTGINGKAFQLQAGIDQSAASSTWIVTIDADVRPAPGFVTALLAQAERESVSALSVATRQQLSGAAEAIIHPSLLTTLVYRFGIPGHATDRVAAVQANGQCFLIGRDLLREIGGFAAVQDSICEDVTLARALADAGHKVGFYEAGDLVSVAMYAGARDAWDNWSRSLPMRDRYSGLAGIIGLAEATLVQALPLWLTAIGVRRWSPNHPLLRLNAALLMARLGVLAGTRRAYRDAPATYWLSPIVDLPATLRLWFTLTRRRQVWRGRPITRGGPS